REVLRISERDSPWPPGLPLYALRLRSAHLFRSVRQSRSDTGNFETFVEAQEFAACGGRGGTACVQRTVSFDDDCAVRLIGGDVARQAARRGVVLVAAYLSRNGPILWRYITP